MKKALLAGVAVAMATGALGVHAEERDPAAAQALFDQARALMKAKRFDEACPKLAESQRLDPGIGTQFRLADCYEQQGKIASAWAGFLDVASLAAASNQGEREKAARQRAAKLEARLPHLTIDVPAASRVDGLAVKRDGVVVGDAQWGSPVPVDPGDHVLVASAPGHRDYSAQVSLHEGASATVGVPSLAEQTVAAAPPKEAAAPASVSVAPPPPPSPGPPIQTVPPPVHGSGPSAFVVGLGALGLVGVGVGTVFGVMASSKYDDSKGNCRKDDVNLCSAQGVDQRNTAFTYGNVATTGFIVGGVALAGAATLWIFGGHDSEAPPAQTAAAFSWRAGLRSTADRRTVVVEGRF
jgi:cell division septation protein DedD